MIIRSSVGAGVLTWQAAATAFLSPPRRSYPRAWRRYGHSRSWQLPYGRPTDFHHHHPHHRVATRTWAIGGAQATRATGTTPQSCTWAHRTWEARWVWVGGCMHVCVCVRVCACVVCFALRLVPLLTGTPSDSPFSCLLLPVDCRPRDRAMEPQAAVWQPRMRSSASACACRWPRGRHRRLFWSFSLLRFFIAAKMARLLLLCLGLAVAKYEHIPLSERPVKASKPLIRPLVFRDTDSSGKAAAASSSNVGAYQCGVTMCQGNATCCNYGNAAGCCWNGGSGVPLSAW